MSNARKLKSTTVNLVNCQDLDNLVEETYGKPFCFQQQNGCRERGTIHVDVYSEVPKEWDFVNNTLEMKVNGPVMGISFAGWLNTPVDTGPEIWWHRNCYPEIEVLMNDLHKRGLVDTGEYIINIDW